MRELSSKMRSKEKAYKEAGVECSDQGSSQSYADLRSERRIAITAYKPISEPNALQDMLSRTEEAAVGGSPGVKLRRLRIPHRRGGLKRTTPGYFYIGSPPDRTLRGWQVTRT